MEVHAEQKAENSAPSKLDRPVDSKLRTTSEADYSETDQGTSRLDKVKLVSLFTSYLAAVAGLYALIWGSRNGYRNGDYQRRNYSGCELSLVFMGRTLKL